MNTPAPKNTIRPAGLSIPVPAAEAFGQHGTGLGVAPATSSASPAQNASAVSSATERNIPKREVSSATKGRNTLQSIQHLASLVGKLREDVKGITGNKDETAYQLRELRTSVDGMQAVVEQFEGNAKEVITQAMSGNAAAAEKLQVMTTAVESMTGAAENLNLELSFLKETHEALKALPEESQKRLEILANEAVQRMQQVVDTQLQSNENLQNYLSRHTASVQESANAVSQLGQNVGTMAEALKNIDRTVKNLVAPKRVENKPADPKPAEPVITPEPQVSALVASPPPAAPSIPRPEASARSEPHAPAAPAPTPPTPHVVHAPANTEAPTAATNGAGINVEGNGNVVAQPGSHVTLSAPAHHATPRSQIVRNVILGIMAAATLVIAYRAATMETRVSRNDAAQVQQ